MLPIKKIYVDSRHKTEDSISDSNFKFQLPYVLNRPSNCICISEISIPHIWGTIHTHVNDKLYISVGRRDPMMTYITTWTDYICVIPPGNYDESTLTAALQTLIHGMEPYLTVSIDASSIMTRPIHNL